jgi:hypothetical protein
VHFEDGTPLAIAPVGGITLRHHLKSLVLAAALLTAAGCSASVGYRVYDPYRSDYHVWNHDEGVYYDNWVAETHRPHTEFRKLKPEDQHSYFTWRHDHEDHH